MKATLGPEDWFAFLDELERNPSLRRRAAVVLGLAQADAELLPHPRWPTGRTPKRNAELAAAGVIPARKVGRLWMATKADVDAWVASQANKKRSVARLLPANDSGPVDLVAEALAAAGRRR